MKLVSRNRTVSITSSCHEYVLSTTLIKWNIVKYQSTLGPTHIYICRGDSTSEMIIHCMNILYQRLRNKGKIDFYL